jgi:lipopolysaccharide/colanic/teichoic acid biosynthesis glycosyltransferase
VQQAIRSNKTLTMYPIIKRLFDIIFSLIALVLLAPVLLPVMLVLKLTGEKEIFFLQQRLGWHNQKFGIFKFATMLKNSPNIGTGVITLRNDPRVTPVGAFLRRSKINELPQLLNILWGNMSFVGPRPLMQVSFDLYAPSVQSKIYASKPGLTGIGSIIFRDEEKFVTDYGDPKAAYEIVYQHKGAVEMWYQENKGLVTDTMILFLTAWQIPFHNSKLVYKVFKTLPRHQYF